jgi:hypothetical protein
MQSDLIENDKKRHLETIDFVCAIHQDNFVINLQQCLKTLLHEKKMNDVILIILLEIKTSVLFIQVSNQRLN